MNLLLSVAKFIFGNLINSRAILMDAWNGFSDMVSSVLSILSAKLKKTWVMIFFIVGFVCSLSMGYLSTRDFAQASMNWIAEGVNVAGQGSFLIGALLLHKFGLEQLKLKTGECA